MSRKLEFLSVSLIVLVGFFSRFWLLAGQIEAIMALSGVIGVFGLYLLARELYNRRIALITASLVSFSFWHILVSRLGTVEILVSTILVFLFYFLWRGLRTSDVLPFIICGLLLGSTLYLSPLALVGFFVVIVVLVAHRQKIKRDYPQNKYEYLRNALARGLGVLILFTLLAGFPIGLNLYFQSSQFLNENFNNSVFQTPTPFTNLLKNLGLNLAMFNFQGDINPDQNIPGSPQLFWLVGLFFLIGLINIARDLFKYWQNHHHLALVPLLSISWLIGGLLGVSFFGSGVNARLAVIIAPVAYLMAAKGFWWAFLSLYRWIDIRKGPHQAVFAVTATLILLLVAIGLYQYDRYFNQWASPARLLESQDLENSL